MVETVVQSPFQPRRGEGSVLPERTILNCADCSEDNGRESKDGVKRREGQAVNETWKPILQMCDMRAFRSPGAYRGVLQASSHSV